MHVCIRFGVIPQAADAAADFIHEVHKVFNILNSSKTSGAKQFNLAFKGIDYQNDLLNDFAITRNLKVVNNLGA